MTIPVTTRGGKGSELTQSEMDTNLTNLARDASTTQQGNTRYATQAEVDAGSAVSAAVTPDKLASLLNLSDASIGASGYITLQNGLIIQWGTYAGETVGAETTNAVAQSFSTTFPTNVFNVVTGLRGGGALDVGATALTTSGFTLNLTNGSASPTTVAAYWIAIGN